jgi:hypothetical protein
MSASNPPLAYFLAESLSHARQPSSVKATSSSILDQFTDALLHECTKICQNVENLATSDTDAFLSRLCALLPYLNPSSSQSSNLMDRSLVTDAMVPALKRLNLDCDYFGSALIKQRVQRIMCSLLAAPDLIMARQLQNHFVESRLAQFNSAVPIAMCCPPRTLLLTQILLYCLQSQRHIVGVLVDFLIELQHAGCFEDIKHLCSMEPVAPLTPWLLLKLWSESSPAKSFVRETCVAILPPARALYIDRYPPVIAHAA